MPNRFDGLAASLRKKPFFWLLVPWFFLCKNTNTYFTAIPLIQIAWLIIKYSAIAIILYLILSRFTPKESYKAAFCSFFLLLIYFFFNDYDSWLQSLNWIRPFNRYRWSLPALAVLLFLVLRYVYRMKSPPARAISFLNWLMILFCLSGLLPVLAKIIRHPAPMIVLENDRPLPIRPLPAQSPARADRPDIYFILLDEYQGNEGLRKVFHYDNEEWQQAFRQRGFYMPDTARSNYEYTFFSMASVFNMDYLKGEIKGKDRADQNIKFSAAIDLIKDSRLIRFLHDNGYSVHNFSPFLLDGSGQRILQYGTITVEKDLIERQTLFNVWAQKYGWLIPSKRAWRWFNPFDYDIQFYNEDVHRGLIESSQVAPANPAKQGRFVYSHFMIPHTPFMKDSAGREVDFREFMQKVLDNDSVYGCERYLSYIKYGNRYIMETIDTLIKNDPGAIILVMSDHGFRGIHSENNRLQFNIQFYIRTPGREYSNWPRTVDGVNIFRILLNDEFGQHLEYLPYKSKELKLSGY